MKEYRVLSLYSNDLQRNKRIFIYLPRSYHKTDKFYPVLYMHDGHNLFDDKQATYGRSWRIMDVYENNPDLPEVIIVGIDTEGDSRGDELCPYKFTYKDNTVMGGKADAYLNFIISQVKPLIDHRFRTFKSPKNTGLMGSSFGGLNSIYAALVYGAYFTRFGCVSNAFFMDGLEDKLLNLAKSTSLTTTKKFYMDVGTKETKDDLINEKYVDSNKELYSILKDKLDQNHLKFVIAENAIHNEKDWEKRFPDIIKFMFND